MTMPSEVTTEKKFVSAYLPWLIAGGALAVYLVTLNRWVTLNSVVEVAKVSGWTWLPEATRPLYWLVTCPLQWLPAKSIPLALNLLAAGCAFLTLALLARSVALLPHDRTEEQRLRERSPMALLTIPWAWVPPLLAVLACGLQLTFWENATAASSDMLDLLLFAYVIRCVLEFRVDDRHSWPLRASFVYAAAMTNNWAMVGFLPAFLVVLVWIKGVSFFNVRFLTQMFLLGLAGLSFYLLLPLVNVFSHGMHVGFWQALHFNLSQQKNLLFQLPFNKYMLFQYERPLWVLALPSLLPVLAMGVRWPAYFGDPSKLGIALATLFFHLFHGALLLLCAWVALDPLFSPRNYAPWLTLLPLYYLGALSLGYFSGYFLLVFGAKAAGRPRPEQPYVRWLKPAAVGLVWLLLLVLPAGLVYRNWPQLRTANGPMLKQYISLVRERLPEHGAIVLSDDALRLFLLESAVTQSRSADNYFFLESGGSLSYPDYHRFLKKHYPQRWQSDPPADHLQFFDNEILSLVSKLGEGNNLYYLHPSFGYYFELFYAEPHGVVYQLKPYPTNSLLVPLASKDLIGENEAFWKRVDEPLQTLLPAITPPPPSEKPSVLDLVLEKAYLKNQPDRQATALGKFYSRALDFWGVQLQQAGRLTNAAAHFERALDLNPDNRVAQVNLECNRDLQAGRKLAVDQSGAIEDRFGRFYNNWEQIMNVNGPFDEPTMCFAQGRVLLAGRNFGQAAQVFARVQDLVPDFLPARLLLAQLYLVRQMPDRALEAVGQIHEKADLLRVTRTDQPFLLSVEASAHLAKNDLPGAEVVVNRALKEHPIDETLLGTAAQTYKNYGRYSNELGSIDRLLEIHPDNRAVLLEKGFAWLQLRDFREAIPPLTEVVNMETNGIAQVQIHYNALLYRAYAYLKDERWDAAQRDYETLQKAFPTGSDACKIYAGLAETALGKKDTNAAFRSWHLCLANMPTNAPEAATVQARLEELKPRPRR